MDILCGYRIWDQVHGDKNGRDLEMSSPSRETHFVGATLLWSGAPMPCSMNLLHKWPWTFKHLLPLCLNLLVLQMQFEGGWLWLVTLPLYVGPTIFLHISLQSSSYFKNAKNLQFSWTMGQRTLGFKVILFVGWEWVDICHKSEPLLAGYIYMVMHLDSHRIWMNPYLDVFKFWMSGSIHHHQMYAMYTSDVQLYPAH